MTEARQRRILCIDNYDSFVYTIVGYLRQLGAHVDVVRNDAVEAFAAQRVQADAQLDAVERESARTIAPYVFQALAGYDGVLISPGPGDPKGAGDMLDVIAACRVMAVPMLGVCLGHQGMGIIHGATVGHAAELYHGKTSIVHNNGEGLFAGLPGSFAVCRYHSLTIEPDTVPADVAVTAWTDDGVVMAIEHRELPLYGLQFHPESVLTEHGHKLLARWLEVAGDAGAVARAQGMAPIIEKGRVTSEDSQLVHS